MVRLELEIALYPIINVSSRHGVTHARFPYNHSTFMAAVDYSYDELATKRKMLFSCNRDAWTLKNFILLDDKLFSNTESNTYIPYLLMTHIPLLSVLFPYCYPFFLICHTLHPQSQKPLDLCLASLCHYSQANTVRYLINEPVALLW